MVLGLGLVAVTAVVTYYTPKIMAKMVEENLYKFNLEEVSDEEQVE